jgi:hypothetical protein
MIPHANQPSPGGARAKTTGYGRRSARFRGRVRASAAVAKQSQQHQSDLGSIYAGAGGGRSRYFRYGTVVRDYGSWNQGQPRHRRTVSAVSEIENKKRTCTPPNNNGQPAVATSQSGNIAPGEAAMTKKSSTLLSIGTRRSLGLPNDAFASAQDGPSRTARQGLGHISGAASLHSSALRIDEMIGPPLSIIRGPCCTTTAPTNPI